MEHVLTDIPTIIDSSDNKPNLLKPKRSAFIFINTEDDSSHLALEDLRKIDS